MNVSEITTFTFLNVEEEPLLGRRDATIITVTAFVTLVIGVHINYRIYNKLAVKKSNSSRTSIDKLFIANNVVSLIGHPPLLVKQTSIQSNVLNDFGDKTVLCYQKIVDVGSNPVTIKKRLNYVEVGNDRNDKVFSCWLSFVVIRLLYLVEAVYLFPDIFHGQAFSVSDEGLYWRRWLWSLPPLPGHLHSIPQSLPAALHRHVEVLVHRAERMDEGKGNFDRGQSGCRSPDPGSSLLDFDPAISRL